MTVMDGGKPIVTELTSVNLTISRYEDDEEHAPADAKTAKAGKDSAKVKLPGTPRPRNGNAYIGAEAKNLSPEMLKILARNKAKFDGSITITDPTSRKVVKTLKFKQGSLYSYSDQFSAVGYSDSYGSAVLSINCKELAIDGVNFEQ
ncbi:hypothetical protein BC343_04330 [Mucilaginibacter pedocola]|uniref:Uncharacterized protein n=2 Tax=Mucilaginibacter pedocola TaxID=1792845 RepID=A0A1S9PFW6_9SPHI|nr:hypothetical protein BC343_04330 [Mucilaginibacter pedocola]